MNNPKIKEEEILRNLEASFEEAFKQDRKAKRALLKEMGYDPDKLVTQGLDLVKRLIAQQKLKLMGELWQKTSALVSAYSNKFKDLSGDQLRLRIEEAFTGDRVALQTAFRDLKEVCEDDLRVILEDAGILDEWNNLAELE